MTAESQIYAEAMAATAEGEKNRAKDLFTRLIQLNPNCLEYWLGMSAVVDTPRERTYCLKEALRIDPDNQAARRGLILLGALPSDSSLAIPLRFQRRNWQSQLERFAAPEPVLKVRSWKQAALFGGALVLLVAVLVYGAAGLRANRAAARFTPWPAATFFYASPTAVTPSATPVPSGPVPLVMLLQATYTPTPLYVNTPHPISEAYRSALRAYERKDWPGMLNFLEQVSTLEPQAPDVWYHTGEAYRFQGNFERAIQAYNRSLAISPAFAPAYLGRARATLGNSADRWKEAQADLQQALQLDPGLFEAHLELAQIEIRLGNGEAALARLEPAASLAPDSLALYDLRAQAYLLAGQNEAALVDALRANQIDLTYLPAYRLVGSVYFALGDPLKAVESLETYVTYVEDDPLAWAWLGESYTAAGNAEKALDAFGRSLKLAPRQFDAYLSRGLLYLEQDELELAEEDLLKALSINARSFPTYIALGKVYLAQGRSRNAYVKLSEAEAYSQTEAEQAEIYYYRAQSLENINETNAAIKDWKALLALPQDDLPPAWARRARQRLQALYTPTFTPPTPSVTHTRRPTLTSTSTRTRQPTNTPLPTHTRQPTRTTTPTPGK